MAGEKIIKLLGVRHYLSYFKEVKEFLGPRLRPGQSIGIESNPVRLKQFEEIHKSGKDFLEAFKPLWIAEARMALPPEKVSDWLLEQDYKKVVPTNEFFYKLFVLAKQKNIEIIPLGSHYADIKSRILDLTTGIFSFKKRRLRQFIRIPARERFMVLRIMKLKPDFVVVGAGHVEEIKNMLREQGINTKIICYKKRLGDVEFRERLRAKYLRIKTKQREKRLRKLTGRMVPKAI